MVFRLAEFDVRFFIFYRSENIGRLSTVRLCVSKSLQLICRKNVCLVMMTTTPMQVEVLDCNRNCRNCFGIRSRFVEVDSWGSYCCKK